MQSIIKILLQIVGSETLITDIQQIDILSYRKELLLGNVRNEAMPDLNKTGRTPATVNEQIRTLCAMLKFAKRSQIISYSPIEDITSLKPPKKH